MFTAILTINTINRLYAQLENLLVITCKLPLLFLLQGSHLSNIHTCSGGIQYVTRNFYKETVELLHQTEVLFSSRNHKANLAARCLYFSLTKYTKAQNSLILSLLYRYKQCFEFKYNQVQRLSIFYVNTKQFCMYVPLVHLQCKHQRRCNFCECHLT